MADGNSGTEKIRTYKDNVLDGAKRHGGRLGTVEAGVTELREGLANAQRDYTERDRQLGEDSRKEFDGVRDGQSQLRSDLSAKITSARQGAEQYALDQIGQAEARNKRELVATEQGVKRYVDQTIGAASERILAQVAEVAGKIDGLMAQVVENNRLYVGARGALADEGARTIAAVRTELDSTARTVTDQFEQLRTNVTSQATALAAEVRTGLQTERSERIGQYGIVAQRLDTVEGTFNEIGFELQAPLHPTTPTPQPAPLAQPPAEGAAPTGA